MLTRSRAGGTRAGPEARECQALIEASYRHFALKRMLKALDLKEA